MRSRQSISTKTICSASLLIAMLWSMAAAADDDSTGEGGQGNTCPQRHFGEFSDWSHPVNLGPTVNSTSDDFHPAISPNGLSLYITSMRPGFGGSDIWVSQRANLRDAWGPPRNLGPTINSEGNDFAPDLTPDGHWMLFSSTRPPGTLGAPQIWASFRKDADDDFGWSAPVNLGSDINVSGLDNNAPTFFREPRTGVASIYFNSILRRDGPGDYDIYVSRQRRDGTFGPAVLVPELSSARRDTRTAIRRDGREMFITSGRTGGSGGNDLWVSTRAMTADVWSTPVNLGPTINTAADDGGPALSCDGTTLYFYSTRAGGSGGRDLYVTTRLIEHVVAPQATDPAIDQALQNHYAWLDPAARSNHKLLVFMPGTATPPGSYQLVQREAARLGYHVIGLMYPNSVRLVGACPGTADPNACFENARLQILDGIDRHTVVDVKRPNSIDNRLTKLLQYLTARYPEEGWSRFLAHGEPKWSRIAVSGHSQGGGQAAMIAKLRVVPRVVLFSAVPDNVSGFGPPTWETSHATRSERYWGLAHEHDPAFQPITASWQALGMNAFGRRVRVEESGPPYGLTHTLTTDLLPKSGSYTVPPNGSHGSTAGDDSTPIASDGTPLLRDAWRYLLTAQANDDDANEE
jgi:WD40 repeat protein